MPYELYGEQITEAQLSALGGDFSGNNWRAELASVRAAAFESARIRYGSLVSVAKVKEAVVSGPWPIATINSGVLGMTQGAGAFASGVGIIFGIVVKRDEAQFIFPDNSSASVGTRIEILGGAIPDYQEPITTGVLSANDSTRTFRVNIKTGGRSGRLYGVFLSGVNGPPSEIQIECNVGHSVSTTGPLGYKQIVIDDSSFGGGEVFIKATRGGNIWRGNVGAEGLLCNARDFTWTHTETSKTSFHAIHGSSDVYAITPPRASEIGAFMPQGDDVTISNPLFSPAARYYYNQAPISHFVSPSRLYSGLDGQRGVWLVKTRPISSAGTDQDNMTPAALNATSAATSGAWGPVSTAIEYQIPRYHFRRNTGGAQPAVLPDSVRAVNGSCIHSVFIRRAPVESGDYRVQNPATSAATVTLGCFRGSAFVPFQAVTLAAGEVEKRVEMEQELWPILSPHYLLYDCSEKIDVQAVICTPLDLVANGTAEDNSAVAFPIMPWHYEDTQRLQSI